MSKMDKAIGRARDLAADAWPADLTETLKRQAARFAHTARHEMPAPRRGHPLLLAAGGVLFGLGASALLHRWRARADAKPVGTYFTGRTAAPHAGAPIFGNEEEAFLAEGAGFEDPTGGEPLDNQRN